MVTSCLYHLSERDTVQSTTILDKIRRISKANHSKYALQLKEINLEMSALKQKIDGLEKRNKFQSKQVAALEGKIEYYKSFLSFDEDFGDDNSTLETSQTQESPNSQNSSSQDLTPSTQDTTRFLLFLKKTKIYLYSR